MPLLIVIVFALPTDDDVVGVDLEVIETATATLVNLQTLFLTREIFKSRSFWSCTSIDEKYSASYFWTPTWCGWKCPMSNGVAES